jgi:hypothetical protein
MCTCGGRAAAPDVSILIYHQSAVKREHTSINLALAPTAGYDHLIPKPVFMLYNRVGIVATNGG